MHYRFFTTAQNDDNVGVLHFWTKTKTALQWEWFSSLSVFADTTDLFLKWAKPATKVTIVFYVNMNLYLLYPWNQYT